MKFPILGIRPDVGKRWKIGELVAKELVDAGLLVVYEGKVRRKIYHGDESSVIENPFWSHLLDVGTAEKGKQELSEILGKEHGFDTVKPRRLIEHLLSHHNNDIVVLDFFAGSGTMAHAVLQLNAIDKGMRKYILCTNNEGNICTDVCYPRITKVSQGYKPLKGAPILGLGGNLKYYRTAFVKNLVNRDDFKMQITRECTEMLCLREGIFDERKASKNPSYRIFEQGEKVMGVYYSFERKDLKLLKKDMDELTGEKILYCFTLNAAGLEKNDFADWKGVRLEPIPQQILDVYKQIYEY